MTTGRARWDLLVIANPVWETAWLVDGLPREAFDPACALDRHEDGGGSALNTASALARAGRRVVVVGRVADDPEGRASLEALARRGIEARVEIERGRRTKSNHLYVDRASAATAFRAFIPAGCVEAWEEEPAVLLEASMLLLDRLAGGAGAWLRARRAAPGFTNALNQNSPPMRDANRRRLREALPWLDYLQVSEGGAGAPSGFAPRLESPGDRGAIHSPGPAPPMSELEIQLILEAGVAVVVRTRGERGVHVSTRAGEEIAVPAQPTAVVDPTGAGDAFAAGYLDAWMDGLPPADAARRGVDWAARACRHLGARAWLDHEPPERM